MLFFRYYKRLAVVYVYDARNRKNNNDDLNYKKRGWVGYFVKINLKNDNVRILSG